MRICIAIVAATLLSAFTNFDDDIGTAQKDCASKFEGNAPALAFCLGHSERQVLTAYTPQLLPAFSKYSARRFELANMLDDKKITFEQFSSLLQDARTVLMADAKNVAAQYGQTASVPQTQATPSAIPTLRQEPTMPPLATMLLMGTAFLNGYNNAEAARRDRGPVMTTCNRAGNMINCLSD